MYQKQAAIFFLITVMMLSGCSRKYAQTKTTQNQIGRASCRERV